MHTCPGGCGRSVPDHLFACGNCWFRLPIFLRNAIRATYKFDPDAHQDAMAEAMKFYAQEEG